MMADSIDSIKKISLGVVCMLLLVFFCQIEARAANNKAIKNFRIITSHHPLALIIDEAYENVEVMSLLPPMADIHHYSLKPSDIKKLSEADLILWSGEPFLVALMKRYNALDIRSFKELPWLFVRDDAYFQYKIEHYDLHFWLDVEFTKQLLRSIGLYFENKGHHLQQNPIFFKSLRRNIRSLRLLSMKQLKVWVGHDAFRYLFTRASIEQLGALEKKHGLSSLKTRISLIKKAKNNPGHCLLMNKQTKVPKQIKDLVEIRKVDVMAKQWPMGKHGYTGFYNQILRILSSCK